MTTLEFSTELPVSAKAAYEWHERPGALERLTPPWEAVRVIRREGTLAEGRVELALSAGGATRRWVARHRDGIPGRLFVDEQVEGPFARWVHTHRFEPLGPDRCQLIDQIAYQLPLGSLGSLGEGWVERRLARGFRYRHDTLRDDLAAHARFASETPLTVVVTGAGGLIGRSLLPFLTTGGHRVRRLARGAPRAGEARWDPASGQLDSASLDGADAVIHLAGEPIANGRWSGASKHRILDSRVRSTTLVAETMARLARPPRTLISASATGIYGDRGDQPVTEAMTDGAQQASGFLARVGRAWEAATELAADAGIRVVRLRIGLVLSPAGGALGAMLPPFLAGLGGRLGSGRQYMSWISLDDVVGALHHALLTPALDGPVNATAPEPATNGEFSETLARVLHRPAFLPVPAGALRLLLGEMADELLLSGVRVLPKRLLSSGYRFRHPTLEHALRHVLGRSA
ncbi:MAG: TIGR01777 family oxidoreductase [Gemmatimonadota bacterium]|nr:TIGR01777 family oxidoreductase [Gemmatimonadota bacterium]